MIADETGAGVVQVTVLAIPSVAAVRPAGNLPEGRKGVISDTVDLAEGLRPVVGTTIGAATLNHDKVI